VTDPAAAPFDLAHALAGFAARHPHRAIEATLFTQFLHEAPTPFARSNRDGHFTASSWLVDRHGGRTLLTHHRKLGRWLQLGGHADGDTDLVAVALREAEEESGLRGLQVAPAIFDIDRHRIPARGDEPAHWHYDVRFVVRAGADEAFTVSAESHSLAWREIAAVVQDPAIDASLRRMAAYWLAGDDAGSGSPAAA
jgi:8-oxo-dGTP pyrophosphatase MutT (NUDIX family)